MSDRHVRYYENLQERRRLLVIEMGGVCHYCGAIPEDVNALEFNHTAPRRWRTETTSRTKRLELYREDWQRKELDLACGPCNKKLGKPKTDLAECDPEWIEDGIAAGLIYVDERDGSLVSSAEVPF